MLRVSVRNFRVRFGYCNFDSLLFKVAVLWFHKWKMFWKGHYQYYKRLKNQTKIYENNGTAVSQMLTWLRQFHVSSKRKVRCWCPDFGSLSYQHSWLYLIKEKCFEKASIFNLIYCKIGANPAKTRPNYYHSNVSTKSEQSAMGLRYWLPNIHTYYLSIYNLKVPLKRADFSL